MKKELLEYHIVSMVLEQKKLNDWIEKPAPYGDEERRLKHVKAISTLVDFHKRAVDYLTT